VGFDIGVWYEPAPPTDGEAAHTYARLQAGDLGAVEPSPAVAAFYGALTSRFPELDRLPDDEVDASPWTAPLEVSTGHVLATVAWSRVAEVAPIVVALSPRLWFAILERPGAYVQVGLGGAAGAPPGRYALEHREGSPPRHDRCVVAAVEEVVAAFEGFATRDPTWVRRFAWQPLPPQG